MFDGRLETLIKVAESGSFTKAADALYVTPTAVMKQINALEKELSVTLFERTNHHPRGRKLFAGCTIYSRIHRTGGPEGNGDRRRRKAQVYPHRYVGYDAGEIHTRRLVTDTEPYADAQNRAHSLR